MSRVVTEVMSPFRLSRVSVGSVLTIPSFVEVEFPNRSLEILANFVHNYQNVHVSENERSAAVSS